MANDMTQAEFLDMHDTGARLATNGHARISEADRIAAKGVEWKSEYDPIYAAGDRMLAEGNALIALANLYYALEI